MTPGRVLRIARQRLRSISRTTRMEAELEREFGFHFDQLVLEKVAEGLSPEQARVQARRMLGNVALLKDQCRDQRGVRWVRDLQQDAWYGLRTLRKSPAFTAVAVVSLALGIGANSALLGVIDAVLREDLPLANAGSLVVIRTVPLENPAQTSGVSLRDFAAWKEGSTAFAAMDLSLTGPRDLHAEGNGLPSERITGQSVTPGLFAVLGVQPLMGRIFTDDDARADASVIISHRLWQRRYGENPRILDSQIRIDGRSRTVIGILPGDFRYGDPRVDCWTPFAVAPKETSATTGRFFGVTARLRPGKTVEQAQADLGAIAARLARDYPESHSGWGVRVQPLREALFGWAREPLLTLQAAVVLVLLIACANVAALLLARGAVRRREIAMRVALGASRGRIVRQLLTEGLLLSLAGGLLGLVVAWWGVQGLTAMSPPLGSPRMAEMGLNLRILAMTGLLSIVTGLTFGLAPALTVSQLGPIRPLEERHEAGTRRRPPARTVLVAAQLALALILLIGSGLLMKSFLRLAGRELNFEPAGLLTLEFRSPVPQRPLGQYRGFRHFEMTATPWHNVERLYERLRLLPGAVSVAGISYPPVDSLILPVMSVSIEGRSETVGNERRQPTAAYFLVTPGFFHTMKTPFVRGRDVAPADTVSRPWVAIINEAAAARFWPGENPIGRHLTIDVVPEERPREVIGIVPDIPVRHGQTEPHPVVYASYLQQPSRYAGPYGGMFGQMTFVMRHDSDPMSLVAGARKAAAAIEPDRALGAVMTAEQRLDIGTEKRRYNLLLVGFLACTATILAAIGVYGMLAYLVGQRTREIGIRKALGAGTRDVVMFVASHVVAVLLGGLLFGWLGALALMQLISSQLWGITATDPGTFAGVSLLLVSTALTACIGPTRRAIAVDPAATLRHD